MADPIKNIEDLTDAEILAMEEPPELEASSEEETNEDLNNFDETHEESQNENEEAFEESDDQDQTDEEEDLDDEDTESESEEENDTEINEQEDAQDDIDSNESEDSSEEESNVEPSSTENDYKGFYEQITAPFRANGIDVQVDNADDAIKLMQMGAGFNKKMMQLKPNLKLIKMLENNSLLDENKISFLIELDKKNPEAIKKLVKDSKIDVLDIDTDDNTESTYKPKSHAVDDSQVDLDLVIDKISQTDSYETTSKIVQSWDETSRLNLARNPSNLEHINRHVAKGIYDQINAMVAKERALGNLTGLSDLEAYQAVGTYMTQNNMFKRPENEVSADQNSATSIPLQSKRTNDPNKLKKRKQAASAPKKSPGNQTNIGHKNPLNLSDEEIMNMEMPT